MVKKRPFNFPMRNYEKVIGILYIPVHALLLPLILSLIVKAFGLSADGATMNLLVYAFSALFLLLSMNAYWRATIRDLAGAPFRALQAVILGMVMYYVLNVVISLLLTLIVKELRNPNTAAVTDIMALNPNMTIVIMVLLAPIAEETMFRGAIFGTIRQKSRVLAYAVSTVLFAAYHLWGYAPLGSGLSFWIYALEYIPGAIALAWCYEWSGSLAAPVVVHALVNLIGAITIVWR